MEDTPSASAAPARAGRVPHAAHHNPAGAPPPPSSPPEHAGAVHDVMPVDDMREPQRGGPSPPPSHSPSANQPQPAQPQQPRESATDLPGGSVAWSCPPMPAEPASLVGRRVRREFLHAGVFEGVISGARLLSHFGWLWHIRYVDGDREELPWRELSKCLVPADDGAGDAQPPALAAQLDGAHVMAAAVASPSAAAETSGAPSAAAAAQALADAARPCPDDDATPRFKGVVAKPAGRFHAKITIGMGRIFHIGTFPTAVAAAQAYDTEVRKHKRRVVNFPLPGSDEVQAVPGEAEEKTLQRAAERGTSLVGCRVRVPFTKCNVTTYYDGTVLAKRTRGGEFIVRFDDGDECDCSAAEVRQYTISASAAAVGTVAPTSHAAAPAAVASPPLPKRRRLPQTPATPRTDSDAVASFLRGITPPLQQLDAILAALPSSGITMAHLERLAHADVSSPLFPVMRADMLDGLAIKNAGDKFSFTSAVAALLQPST